MTSNDDGSLNLKYDAMCKTEIMESNKFTFAWSISSFSSRLKEKANGLYLKSKGFRILGPGSKVTDLHVRVYPNGDKTGSKDYTSVYLHTDSEDTVTTKTSITIVSSPNGKRLRATRLHMMKISKFGFGCANLFHTVNELAKFTENDTLTIVLEITVLEEKESVELLVSSNRNEALLDNYHENKLSQDLNDLYITKEYADTSITCGDKSFRCHKIILASRSPVFKAMLNSEMQEKETGSVAIKNMTPEVLERLLGYIYTGHAPCIETLEVLAAADQYQIVGLKELCEMKLCSSIEVGNCLDLLLLGDMYQALSLKTQALDFVSQNLDKIDINECKQTLIKYPTLLFEVMELLLPKRKTNDFVNSGSEGTKRARAK